MYWFGIVISKERKKLFSNIKKDVFMPKHVQIEEDKPLLVYQYCEERRKSYLPKWYLHDVEYCIFCGLALLLFFFIGLGCSSGAIGITIKISTISNKIIMSTYFL